MVGRFKCVYVYLGVCCPRLISFVFFFVNSGCQLKKKKKEKEAKVSIKSKNIYSGFDFYNFPPSKIKK